MSKVRWLRWIAWTAFASVLVIFGVGIYEVQPHQPRWQTAKPTVEEKLPSLYSVHFSPDAATLVTYVEDLGLDEPATIRMPVVPFRSGFVETWDLATGSRLARYPSSGTFRSDPVFSKDGRYCVGNTFPRKAANGEDEIEYSITLVDLREGRETNVPSTGDGIIQFSPACDIFVHIDQPGRDATPNPLSIYESATGKLLDRRQSHGIYLPDTFTDDHLLHRLERKDGQTTVELWSLTARKPVETLSKPGWFADFLSRDRGRLILYEGAIDKNVWAQWDLTSREFKTNPHAHLHRFGNPSPDGKWVGARVKASEFLLHDAAIGEVKGKASIPLERFVQNRVHFSPDSRFLVSHESTGADDLQVFAVPSMELLWKTKPGDGCDGIGISQDSNTLYASCSSDNAIRLFDMQSGESRGSIDLPCQGPTFFQSTPDRRFLTIHRSDFGNGLGAKTVPQQIIEWIGSFFPRPPRQSSESIIVYDTVSNCERFRLTGWACDDVLLSDDGATLVTSHDHGSNTIRCWDVGWKPLHWAVGVPTTLGASLVALVLAYGRWRRKPTPST
ncbi:MAG TPA: hypothetical protein VFE62_18295 [Gemmataceae bacterium]|nr:hypothetical protein [Gemmataceae bacterium]